ncbi:MAG: T9SS type A sorting domain-containing protein [Bacteroidetes bacterium]|nr:T9SS type A sorting domain-containing protein [Bacteroidota bacterium]
MIKKFTYTFFAWLLCTSAYAQPANDNCASATVLTVNAAAVSGTSASATIEAGEPTPSCGTLKQTVWYKFVATATTHEVKINKLSGGCTADGVVYSGTCFTFTQIGTNCNISGGTNPNTIDLGNLTVGNTYYIHLPYNNGGACGSNWTWDIQVVTCGGSAKTWLTTGTTAWGTATNWSPSGVPGSCDDVVIPSGGTQPTISAAAVCHNLTINASAVLTVSNPLDIHGSINNNGRMDNPSLYFVDLYGQGTWGGTGTFATGAGSVNGEFRMQDGANYTLTGSPTIRDINWSGLAATPQTNGALNFSTYTITTTGTWGAVFYNNFNSGMLNLQGGGSVDTNKTDYGTGILYINSSVNNFGFNLEDDYYTVWFNNSAGATKFGSAAKNVYIKQDMWIKLPCNVDLSTSGSNNIEIGHDFINDDQITPATSTIEMWDFNVAQTQNITSTNGTITTFNGLSIKNSGPGVYLQLNANTNTTSTGILTLKSGPFYLNGYKFNVQYGPTAAIVRTSGRIVSETNSGVNPSILQWNIGSNTGAHIVPFGTASGTYLPVTFNNTGAVGNISFSTRKTTNACATPCVSAGVCNLPWAGASNVAAVNTMFDQTLGIDGSCSAVIDRWWDITSSLASPIPSVSLTFNYDGSENTMAVPTDVVGFQHWAGTYWNDGKGGINGTYTSSGSAGSAAAGAHAVTASGFTYFSPYVLSRITAPLPIELLSFNAECNNGNKVVATWETATEQSSDYFTLEKSTDGSLFIPVTKVKAAGNSSSIQKYSAEDTDPLSAASYYRLSETDLNGATQIFNMIPVQGCGKGGFAVYPNPSSGAFNVSIAGRQGDKVLIVVRDLLDREFYSEVILLANDKETIAIDPSGKLAAGVYFVVATSNDAVYKKKLVIK